MGKSDAPKTPDYEGQAITEANLGMYNTTGPNGTTSWTRRPGADPDNPQPGDLIFNTTLSPQQQALQNQLVSNQMMTGRLASQLAGQSNQQDVRDATYNQLTNRYDEQFSRSEDQMRARLQNQGLTEGSEAWSNAMSDFLNAKNDAYAQATDRSIIAGENAQNDATTRLTQLLAASRGESPTQEANYQSPDLVGALQSQYAGDLNATNIKNQNTAAATGTAVNVAGMVAMLAIY